MTKGELYLKEVEDYKRANFRRDHLYGILNALCAILLAINGHTGWSILMLILMVWNLFPYMMPQSWYQYRADMLDSMEE